LSSLKALDRGKGCRFLFLKRLGNPRAGGDEGLKGIP
jgi:hypothetical protein